MRGGRGGGKKRKGIRGWWRLAQERERRKRVRVTKGWSEAEEEKECQVMRQRRSAGRATSM